MKQIVAGILAHVDAGKTTLSEALLYRAGTLRQLGRVDNGDAFLDTDTLEKRRGITIFSHQAQLRVADLDLTLLDTPGHVDFASQMEQVLSVLDVAILVVSAADGVQGHTRTLWRLLERYHVPTFIFVNKVDMVGVDQDDVLAELQQTLSPACLQFGPETTLTEEAQETIAVTDEAVLADYLETGTLPDATVQVMIGRRTLFPVYFGAALKMTGIDDFMAGLAKWTQAPAFDDAFGARVFKITHDENGERLTWLRVVGGTLHARDVIGEEKVNQIRIYNGAKFTTVTDAPSGTVCAVTGLTTTHQGDGLGNAQMTQTPAMTPVLTYALNPGAVDIHACLTAIRALEDEDPALHVTWSAALQEIRVHIMGDVQLEVLTQLLHDRYHLDVVFDQGGILYQETITAPIEGVGHFEPLRHYSEVHLRLQPLPAGSGLVFDTDCSLEVLGRNWQHQVLTSLGAKTHLGILMGAPLTDTRITLVAGRSHLKHSEGGDFREATWRAVRQGLMMLREQQACQLLEPWYTFRLEVPQEQVGRAMTDIQRMNGTFDAPDTGHDASMAVVTGTAPVASMQGYAREVQMYTHGTGQLTCTVAGYRPCHDEEAVLTANPYQPVADLPNTPDSVFCAHGAGYPVSWRDVPGMAHVAYVVEP